MIEIGTKVKFIPFFNDNKLLTPAERRSFATVGTVVYVNHDHKYFTAEYDCLGTKQRESFKFYYLGKMVKVCG